MVFSKTDGVALPHCRRSFCCRDGGGNAAASVHVFGKAMGRFIKEGTGWRLGWNPAAPVYQGLIAGSDWAIELTEAEFQDFCQLAQQLTATLQQMASELMVAERIAIEAETVQIWLEAEGFPHEYGLHVIVLTGRGCEGEWPATATAELVQALPQLTLF